MKHLVFFVALLSVAGGAIAHEFSEVCSSGQTLYYSTLNNKASVECAGSGSNPYNGYVRPAGNLVIPDSVTHNGYTYPVTTINSRAFYECSDLLSVIIPNSVTAIAPEAFYGCSGLTAIEIPASITQIRTNAFANCSGLQSVVFNAVECTQMGTTSKPVFQNCTSLTTLTVGAGVTCIPSYAFKGCSSLENIFSHNSVPPTVNNVNAFENVDKNIPLIVPAGSHDAYAAAYAWREFFNISEDDESPQGITDAGLDNTVVTIADGRITLTGAEGLRVTLTDIQGRILHHQTATPTHTIDVPATGVYLLQVDNHPARRISVVK